VPAHNYTYSFEPRTDWPSVYASSRDIFTYFDDFAKKYELRKFIKFAHSVDEARWNPERGGYNIRVKGPSGEQIGDTCDILVNACGILNFWKWPSIEGLESFKGVKLHSANWDESVSLKGKTVGLIGNGSSGIQILPAIQPQVMHVTTFVRNPTWISPTKGMEDHTFSPEEIKEFTENHEKHLTYRQMTERSMNSQWGLFSLNSKQPGADMQKTAQEFMRGSMSEKLKNSPHLKEMMIPKWDVGCRRLTPGIGYLEALGKDNVDVAWGDISRITPNGIQTANGQRYDFEILVCATGFDTSFRPRFPIVNNKNENLQDVWSKTPESYLGVAVAEFPNYFTFAGPNSPLGNGPVLSSLEKQADFMLHWMDRWQTENLFSFSPKKQAVQDFIEYRDDFMSRTVWTQECKSWYKNGTIDGPVTAVW
jgi:cation diffusion facilitator CzcD-associated flavoprotein CzcO